MPFKSKPRSEISKPLTVKLRVHFNDGRPIEEIEVAYFSAYPQPSPDAICEPTMLLELPDCTTRYIDLRTVHNLCLIRP